MIGRIDVRGHTGTPMRVIYVPKGGKSPNYAAEPGKHGLVEFYDLRYMHTPDGQFISRYTLDTYLENYDNSLGLDLMGYEKDWKINADTRMIIGDWIKYLTKQEAIHA